MSSIDPQSPPTGPVPVTRVPALTLGSVLSESHTLLKANYGVLLGAALLVLVIQIGVGAITGAIDALIVGPKAMFKPMGVLTQIFVGTPLAVGPGLLAAKRFRTGDGDIGTIFAGFTRYGPVVVIGLITTVVTWVILAAFGLSIAGAMSLGGAGIFVAVVIGAIAFVLFIFLGVRFWFGAIVCVDPSGPMPGGIDSLVTSWRMTEGKVLPLVGIGIVVGLLLMLSFLLLILPFFFYGLPMVICVAGVIYALLAHQRGLVPMSGYDACPNCAYPLRGVAGDTCPECGAIVPRNA